MPNRKSKSRSKFKAKPRPLSFEQSFEQWLLKNRKQITEEEAHRLAHLPVEIEIPKSVRWNESLFHYIHMVRDLKTEPKFAEMLALKSPPGLQTDTSFTAEIGTLDKQFGGHEELVDHLCNAARKKGYNPSPNDWYNPAIATCYGDPQAFISPGEGRGKVKAVVEENGWTVDGGVNHRSSKDPEPEKNVRLAPHLIEEMRQHRFVENPDLIHADQRELTESIIEDHGGPEKYGD